MIRGRITFAPFYHELVWKNIVCSKWIFTSVHSAFLSFHPYLLPTFGNQEKGKQPYMLIVSNCGDLAVEGVEFFSPQMGFRNYLWVFLFDCDSIFMYWILTFCWVFYFYHIFNSQSNFLCYNFINKESEFQRGQVSCLNYIVKKGQSWS